MGCGKVKFTFWLGIVSFARCEMFVVGFELDKNECLDGFHVMVGWSFLEKNGEMGL